MHAQSMLHMYRTRHGRDMAAGLCKEYFQTNSLGHFFMSDKKKKARFNACIQTYSINAIKSKACANIERES